ncbi:MAG: DMT family transporter [Prochlorothrix sp.]|nr:DMT family transporter [Prochlorothrix sp.]
MTQLDLPRPMPVRSNVTTLLTLCIALLAVSFAPIFIRLSEEELGPNGTVFNRMLIFSVVFGLGRFLQSYRQAQPDRSTAPNETSSSLLNTEADSIAPDSESASASIPGQTQSPSPNDPITFSQWILLLMVGVVAVTTLVLWAMSLQYTSVAKSMLLNNLTPVFTTLGGWLFLRQRFGWKFLLGMVVALGGALALGLEDLGGADGNLLGDFYALMSAVFLGAYFLVVEQLRYRFSATTILLWRCAIGSCLLLPLVWFTEGQLFPTTLSPWLAVIGLGLISEGLGQRLLAESMKSLSSSFISIFLLLEPIVSALLAWAIFAESLSSTTWVGFAVILSGIYLAKSGPGEQNSEVHDFAEV